MVLYRNGMMGILCGMLGLLSVSFAFGQTNTSEPSVSEGSQTLAPHHTVQDQNTFLAWDFDQETAGGLPSGFTSEPSGNPGSGPWRIEADPTASIPSQVLTQTSPCQENGCYRVLLADTREFVQPDIVAHLRRGSSANQGEAGIVLAAKDPRNFYAVTVNPATGHLSLYRAQNGEATLLGTGQGKLKTGSWHVLRVQVVNSAHIDHPRFEVYLDGYETELPDVEHLQGGGKVGLITTGNIEAQFDRLHVMEMTTSRPFSKPAAY